MREFDHHSRDDRAQERVLHCLQALAHSLQEVMMVISQLQFGLYLNKPSYAAAAARLPRAINLPESYRQGDFDVLILHSKYGLVTGEVKSVGDNFTRLQMTEQKEDEVVVKVVVKAVKQLNKAKAVLEHLVSDLPGLAITKVLLFPNITSVRLVRALNTNSQALAVNQSNCYKNN